MSCKCGSDRIVRVTGKCSDCFCADYGEMSHQGYIPHDLNIGAGDYIEFSFCADCGKIQNEFPIEEDVLKQVLGGEAHDV